MSSINGIGSTYIGCSEVASDGSYITTEWFIFVIPIIPMRSLRVLQTSHTNLLFFSSSTFQTQPAPFYWPHVIWMYATYLVTAIFILSSKYLIGPLSSNIISSPLLSSVIAFVLSVLAVWISSFIRKGSVFANLIVFAVIITFSFLSAGNMSTQPEKSLQYMYFFWTAYVIFHVIKFLKKDWKKDWVKPNKRQQRVRR